MPALLVAAVAAIILAFFLSIYPLKDYTVPIGWDQSEYLWRTTLAREVGVANIDRPLLAVPNPKSGRPAFPVIAASLSSLTGVHPFRLAMGLTPVMAAVIGLAAGALVAGVLRRPAWEFAVVAMAVGLSSLVVRLMMPEAYLDTMFAASVFLAASIALTLSVETRSALLPTILLLAAGGVIHWSFFVLIAATLLLVGAALLPGSWRRWRSGRDQLTDTPTARVGAALAGGTALAGVTILGGLSGGLPSSRVDLREFAKKLRRDLPKYNFPVTLPLAALGVAPLAAGAVSRRTNRERYRFLLALLLSWSAVGLAGFAAGAVFHLPTPAHRFLSFALPVPILGALGIVALGRLVARIAWPLAAAGIVTALAIGAVVSHVQWFGGNPSTDATKVRDAARALPYLESAGVPADHPVVFIIETSDGNAAILFTHMILAALPAERIPHTLVFVGSPDDFLARRAARNAVSRGYFRRVEPFFEADPVALLPLSFNPGTYAKWVAAHPETEMASRMAVVRGPAPPAGIADPAEVGPPVGRIKWWRLALVAAGSLAALGLIGLGWTAAGLGRWLRPAEMLALAPAVGVAALVMGGVVADRLGIRLVGLGGALTPLVIGLCGGSVALAIRARRKKSLPSPD